MSSHIADNLQEIRQQLSSAFESADPEKRATKPPRLVAVSKTKPKEMVMQAYLAGQRHFGENYVQELVEKANDPEILEKCPDISWHFIGNCQTNKAAKVAQSSNLKVVETVTTAKLADKLQSACAGLNKNIGVMVQVNTSGEDNKNGVEPDDTNALVGHIISNCPNLSFVGLMTIGELGHSLASSEHPSGANPDFLSLLECRKKVASEFGLSEKELDLSMGMSNDFQEAVRMGSTNVRVGSSIFGERSYPVKGDEK